MTLIGIRERFDLALLAHADLRQAVRDELAAAGIRGELMRNDQARAWPRYLDAVDELRAATAVLESVLLDLRNHPPT